MIKFVSDELTEEQKKKLRSLSQEEKIQVLEALQISTPIFLDWMIERHEAAIERDQLTPRWGDAVETWRKLVKILRVARDLFR